MCSSDTIKDFVPNTFREVVDPHYFRTNSAAERRHRRVGIHRDGIPDPPPPPAPPQAARQPDTAPLRRRNAGGIAVPAGSTVLSGPSGVTQAQMNLGSATLLGGG